MKVIFKISIYLFIISISLGCLFADIKTVKDIKLSKKVESQFDKGETLHKIQFLEWLLLNSISKAKLKHFSDYLEEETKIFK